MSNLLTSPGHVPSLETDDLSPHAHYPFNWFFLLDGKNIYTGLEVTAEFVKLLLSQLIFVGVYQQLMSRQLIGHGDMWAWHVIAR